MGRGAIRPNPENCSLDELDVAMAATPSKRAHMRMLALRALLLDTPHPQVAAIFNIHSDTLADWVRWFNESGIDGLLDDSRPGRPRSLPVDQEQPLKELIERPALAERTHWTARALHGHVTQNLQIEIAYSTLVRNLHEMGYALKFPQPWPDRQDEVARQAFARELERLMDDETVELWSMDEMGVEGDPRPRRRWAKRGEKTRGTKNGDHLRENVTGMVCPRTGEFFAMPMSHSDRECFQAFLNEANEKLAPGRPRELIILDNASWHRCKSINWGRYEPLFLPAYSPDLNPIERIWLLIKAEWFNGFVARDPKQLSARVDRALNWVIDRGQANQKTARFTVKL